MASASSLLNFLSPFFPSNTPQQSPPPHLINPNPKSSQPTPLTSTHQTQLHNPITLSKEESPGDLMSVVCPSMAYSNTLFFRSSYNVQVLVDDNESEERLLNRFRREVIKAGVIPECKRRRFFENKHDEMKRKSREAAKRNSRRRRGPQSRGMFQSKEESSKAEKRDDDEDNWDMPQGDSSF